jgi:hypothetical protein
MSAAMDKKYAIPGFLAQRVKQADYERWLHRKAAAHVRRDRRRGNATAMIEEYKRAIHDAVCTSAGRDAYTGEDLDWDLIGTYENERSKEGKRAYKANFALLPTVDHVGDGLGPADFRICAWRTNDSKSDLSHKAFIALCRRVVAFADGPLSDLAKKRSASL